MAIRIYNNNILFLADSDNDTDINLLIESDGLRFTGTLTTAFNVAYTAPPQAPTPAQGTVAGFTSGGIATIPTTTTIDKFPFSISNGTATDIGDLSQARFYVAGQSSETEGFTSGGFTGAQVATIDKFSFSQTSGTATDVGDLTEVKMKSASHSSRTEGFTSGGNPGSSPFVNVTIDKFPFSISSGTATDVGDLSNPRSENTGQSSSTNGFSSGGPGGGFVNIDKFPFAISSGTATDVGNLSEARGISAGQSSSTEGFTSGGETFELTLTIDKFPFAISSGTATDIGDLSQARAYTAGQTSSTEGFTSGGNPGNTGPGVAQLTIDKFPFSQTSGTATDIGDLSQARSGVAGHQD